VEAATTIEDLIGVRIDPLGWEFRCHLLARELLLLTLLLALLVLLFSEKSASLEKF
jgi:hypothetical protein